MCERRNFHSVINGNLLEEAAAFIERNKLPTVNRGDIDMTLIFVEYFKTCVHLDFFYRIP